MLTERPWHQITIDAVAEDAGISRGLLFHYFPTKQHYYSELVAAAAERLLHNTEPDEDASDRLVSVIAKYTQYVARRRGPYLALLRAGNDPDIAATIDDIHAVLTDRVFAARGEANPSQTARLAVHAWWTFAEDLTLQWTALDEPHHDRLDRLLTDTLQHVIKSANRP
jgi:AcrR family transcriptional regulator